MYDSWAFWALQRFADFIRTRLVDDENIWTNLDKIMQITIEMKPALVNLFS